MKMNWESFIIIFGIAQALFLGVWLLSSKNGSKATTFFGALLLLEALGLFEQFAFFSGIVVQSPHLFGLSFPFDILRPSLMFFFVVSYYKEDFKLTKRHWPHLVPFGISLLLFSPLLLASASAKLDYVQLMRTSVWTDDIQSIVFFIMNNVIYAVYLIYSIKIVNQNAKAIDRIKDSGSIWVGRLVKFFAIFFLMRIALYTLNGFHILSYEDIGTVVLLISSFTIQVIAWFLLKNSKLPQFKAVEVPKQPELDRLTNALDVKKVFLDDGLTIEELSHQAGIPIDRLSNLIRIHYGKPFKDVINTMRVNEAKLLIDDYGPDRLNLLGIAMESGFNNKVTFYRAFKKNEGTSPSEYVKNRFSPAPLEH